MKFSRSFSEEILSTLNGLQALELIEIVTGSHEVLQAYKATGTKLNQSNYTLHMLATTTGANDHGVDNYGAVFGMTTVGEEDHTDSKTFFHVTYGSGSPIYIYDKSYDEIILQLFRANRNIIEKK